MNTPSRLGRGLSSLLTAAPSRPPAQGSGVLNLAMIQPGRWQPRSGMDPQELEDLASSIRANGILQPILVRLVDSPAEGAPTHEIIAGERRWRAAQRAGLSDIPVIIRALSEREALAAALIENIQREQLHILDEARALERLIAEHSLTHEEVANAVGRSRAAVSNLLRLLELPDEIVQLIESKTLTMGHGRALAGLTDRALQIRLGQRAAQRGLSVRQVEVEVRRSSEPSTAVAARKPSADPLLGSSRGHLHIQERAGRGRLIVHFDHPEIRDALVSAIEAVLRG